MRDDINIPMFRRRLGELRDAIAGTEQARREAGRTVELDQTRTGRLSRMDALQAQAMAKAGSARAREMVQRIDAALRRIDEGEFGYCIDCGEAIPAGRLDADPAAARCIRCAEARES